MPYSVVPIPKQKTHWLLLNVHYAKRLPQIIHAFGLYEVNRRGQKLKGVITYGIPPSPSLCKGVCGEEWKSNVLELNRLCLVDNQKNEASRLVGASLSLLPAPTIVVSYADSQESHVGFVYQATNFIYTGLSNKHKVWVVKGKEHMHPRALTHTGSLKELKEIYGDELYSKERSRKHRYVYFVGNKKDVKKMNKALKYQTLPYPKETKL
jgi:hypothetical protein